MNAAARLESAVPQPLLDRQLLWVAPGGSRERGGIGQVTRVALEAFARHPEVASVVVLDPRGTGSKWLSLLYWPVALARAVVLSARRSSILHVHIAARGSTVRKLSFVLAGMLTRTPVILHLHAGLYLEWFPALPRWQRAVVAHLFRRAARVIALSGGWADFLVRQLGVEAERVLVLENAVFGPEPAPRRAEKPGREVRILYLGKLVDNKGVPELIEALGRLPGDPPWRGVLAGDGDLPRFQRLAQQAGVTARIDFPGWVGREDVERLLAEADILALPSHWEAMPMSVLEGMAHAAAIVCTPVGALPEILEDGVSARFVAVRDPQALASALASLVADPAERSRVAGRGHEVWRQRFNAEDYASRLAAIYASAVARP